MNKTEFLERLEKELRRSGVSDVAEILSEYEQHFDFKRADGYSDEQIAARLGTPEALAAQFGDADAKKRGGSAWLTKLSLGVSWIFAGIFFALLAAWGIVLAAFALGCAAASVSLILGQFPAWTRITLPYWCGAVLAVALAALAVLSAAGCVYFFAFLRQLIRSYCRFCHNACAAASGGAALPPLPIRPQFSAKTARRLRTTALLSLAVFAASFALAFIVCMLSAGAAQFWHAWGWFGYGG